MGFYDADEDETSLGGSDVGVVVAALQVLIGENAVLRQGVLETKQELRDSLSGIELASWKQRGESEGQSSKLPKFSSSTGRHIIWALSEEIKVDTLS